MSDVYTLAGPLIVKVAGPGGSEAEIDVVMAANALSVVQEERNTKILTECAEYFRPWVARQLGIGVEDITLGQVVEVGQLIVEGSNRNVEECKKKRETTLSSLFSSRESQATTDNGQTPPKTPGSETIPSVKPGEAVSGEA